VGAVSLILLLVLVMIAFAGLVGERIRLDRRRRAVPLLIAVTGTRGKSSVARMLAAVLRESGRRVLAKTTGSEAAFILPDGSERQIRRRGLPSIIEQKRVIRLAAQLGVDSAVVEVMSIHPENHVVETRRLLTPDLVLVTNFRVDHTAAVGETREAVAAALALNVPRGARAFVPQSECLPAFRLPVEARGGEVVEVPTGSAAAVLGGGPDGLLRPFGGNLDLVCAAARALEIEDRAIREGVRRSGGDIGSLRIWRYREDGSNGEGDWQQSCFLVNAFAVNDPESTGLVLDGVTAALSLGPERCVGLLNLRADRGDRTLQWVTALREGFLERFGKLYVMGLHAQAVERRLRRVKHLSPIEVIETNGPAETTHKVLSGIRTVGGVVFGFGNIAGPGEALIAHWSAAGEPVEV
jgi:poly-gamma-glutamate synthase PgsB/CapB